MAIINASIYINGVSPTPPEESEWVLYQTFTTTTAWTVPESNWYRIFCVGKSADGQKGDIESYYDYSPSPYNGRYYYISGGGAGGNSGAIAVSQLRLVKGEVYNITITTSLTSFADLLSAEAGLTGNSFIKSGFVQLINGGSYGTSIYASGIGLANPTIARAYGGNVVNADGFLGGNGAGINSVNNYVAPQKGGNNGGTGGGTGIGENGNEYGSGGGGARYSDLAPINKYSVDPALLIKDGPLSGATHNRNQSGKNISGFNFYNWSAPNVILSGGGGGGGSNGCAIKPSNYLPGDGGQGQPGLVIIEKAKTAS